MIGQSFRGPRGVVRGSEAEEKNAAGCSHAVVLGAGFAGLLAARVLTSAYERVTIIERDDPEGAEPRRGVPQAHHAHTLLSRGLVELERLFPNLTTDLVVDGAVTADAGTDLRLILGGHELARAPLGSSTVQVSRALLDDHLRRRVLDHRRVELIACRDVVGLIPAAVGRRCSGVRIMHRRPGSPVETVSADLVVDATGRGSRLDRWLAAEWRTTVPVDRLTVDLSYASRVLRLPDGLPNGDRGALISTTADCPYGLALLAIEDGRHLVTAVGVGGYRPARDEAGMGELLRTVAPADLATALLAGRPEGMIKSYRIPVVQRRRYERARALPSGVLAIGDAICGLNPIYAQGMTVAVLQAEALGDALEGDPESVHARYIRAAAAVTDGPWTMAVNSDLASPQIVARLASAQIAARPTWTSRLTARLMARIQRVGETDPEVARQFVRVMTMLDPPSTLTRPAFLRRLVMTEAVSCTRGPLLKSVY